MDLSLEEVREIVSRGKPYTLVFLRRGSVLHDEQQAAAIRWRHVGYLMGLRAEGKLLVNGPLTDDCEIVGVSIYGETDPATVRAWVEADPGIQAGYLAYELHPWFGIPGDGLR